MAIVFSSQLWFEWMKEHMVSALDKWVPEKFLSKNQFFNCKTMKAMKSKYTRYKMSYFV